MYVAMPLEQGCRVHEPGGPPPTTTAREFIERSPFVVVATATPTVGSTHLPSRCRWTGRTTPSAGQRCVGPASRLPHTALGRAGEYFGAREDRGRSTPAATRSARRSSGPSSGKSLATGRRRSVAITSSPASTRSMYLLRPFFRSRIPTSDLEVAAFIQSGQQSALVPAVADQLRRGGSRLSSAWRASHSATRWVSS